MSAYPKMTLMTLSLDPKIALGEISSYLRTLSTKSDRAVKQDGEIVGFWQTGEWLDGLIEIADECDKIMKL
jgi:hypothetical protein